MDIDTHIHIHTSNIYSRKKQVMNWKKYMGVWERVWRAKREGVCVIITTHMTLMTKASI